MNNFTNTERRAKCEQVARHLKELNPSLTFAFSDSAVYNEHDGKLGLLYSWAITGQFVDTCDHPLDATGLVKPETLTTA